ncbi:MAG: restriction endonuclease [Ruminococcus flavefaciens]|nr:restriction endonuclease [Ruminococcus flavefaciens]
MATIVEAVKTVLADYPDGLTSAEIYEKIIEKDLYKFNAIKPQSIVNGTIRCHCFGLNFPTASPRKYFKIITNGRGSSKYAIYDSTQSNEKNDYQVNAINSPIKEKLPEEKMRDCYEEHIAALKIQLMNAILNSPPAFFEELVLKLLMKMGYGYDESAGKVTRYCKDGGIDGIIEEDKLGLGKIYIQAKRNAIDNTIGEPIVNQFQGAMDKRGVGKGVFITTSRFVKSVKEEYSKPVGGKMIRLIDGDELMNLLVKYEIGINEVKIYKAYTIDENFFNVQ